MVIVIRKEIMHTCTMGDQRSRVRGRNDLYSYRYTSLSVRVTINGVTGRMIADKSGVNVDHIYLPMQKSDIYFYPGKDGIATQAKLYSADKKKQLDFDWNQIHKNKDRNGNATETFQEGVIHVQEYVSTRYKDPKDKKWKDHFKRKSNNARPMTEAEIAKYGPIILKFNPNVKFRP